MIKVIKENFKDFNIGEFPYDKAHSAAGEYHYLKPEGYTGNWYDPICLHQWRSMDGSWLITTDGETNFIEQNRGDNSHGAFENVYCCLVHTTHLFANYELNVELKVMDIKNYCGVAFNYITSRDYDFVGIKGNTISIYKRYEEDFIVYDSKEFEFDDRVTYKIKISVSNITKVYLNDELIFTECMPMCINSRVALVSKAACRYSNFSVSMTDEQYSLHNALKDIEEDRIEAKCAEYPKMECIKKINLKDFGSARQFRIGKVEDNIVLVFAQHKRRIARDTLPSISCLTCVDLDGNILWQKGTPNHTQSQIVTVDLPFQIADMNDDGELEIIYSMDFKVYIASLKTGEVLKEMDTPVVQGDPLVKDQSLYRLNVDAIRVADFSGLGYKSDFIIKDRYANVWAYNSNMELLWRYNHKNTGHFPYIYDFDDDGYDEMFVGYDMVDHDGTLLWSLPMNSDHTDEIIYTKLKKNETKKLILASGNEGVNICSINGDVIKHNQIGHAQRISVAKYTDKYDGLQILATTFWGSDGIISLFDSNGDLIKHFEQKSNGNMITPINYDGVNVLALLNSSEDGGLIDGELDKVVKFPNDGHPTLCAEVYDIDDDGIDEILCFDQENMWIYKAKEYTLGKKYTKYPDEGFSNYRGEYLLEEEYN